MIMEKSVQLLDAMAVNRAITRLSYEIVEKTDDVSNVVLVGIKTRGIPMARIIAEKISEHGGPSIPVEQLDITFYRDDLSKYYDMPLARPVDFSMDLTGKEVILVDDVIYTGRTIRAAIDAVFSVSRPTKIRLAVLIDRGHRELPIKPDYVGKNVPTSQKEVIKVSFTETDGITAVDLYKKGDVSLG